MDENKEMPLEEAEKATFTANENNEDVTNLQSETDEMSVNEAKTDSSADAAEQSSEPSWEEKYAELNDKYLRQAAEFDNYRKRTVREKADLLKSGGASALTALLPVIDDFERALSNLKAADEVEAVAEGVKLIYDKFVAYLAQQGVKAIEAVGQPFDTELFEAIAMIPAPSDEQKGKVIDCIQTGYKLYDRVIRHSKVVVGE
ncbi:MAG: nucleotide exchange factor GrpE [Tannerella sp.]|jgi:molecular chaperone GrpE|nr:nucleotide exchange factor GrpE [Tannerella sp.]